jgi:hypothetical protein
MKMRSIIVDELTVTDPVCDKVYQDQVARGARVVRRSICVSWRAGADARRSSQAANCRS